MTQEVSLRFAAHDDIDWLFHSLKSMAEEAKMLARFSLTKECLTDTLFTDKLAEVVIASVEERPVGLALFSITNRNFDLFKKPGLFLHEIFVEETFRRQGIATKLKEHLKLVALERGLGRIDFVVLNNNLFGQSLNETFDDARELDYAKFMRIDLSTDHNINV